MVTGWVRGSKVELVAEAIFKAMSALGKAVGFLGESREVQELVRGTS
jgi:hypothetical protein